MNKLSLSKETLVSLEPVESEQIAGGIIFRPGLPPTVGGGCRTMICTMAPCNTVISCNC